MGDHNQTEKKISRELEEIERTEKELLREVRHANRPRLCSIKIRFSHHRKGDSSMAGTVGPITLTIAGQVATATVQGFDQFGNPMPADFVMPQVAFSIDDTAGAIVTSVDNGNDTDTVTAVANGVANLTAKATSAEGLALSDTETITVAISGPPTPVLSSIKVAFELAPSAGTPEPLPGPPPAQPLTPNQKLAQGK